MAQSNITEKKYCASTGRMYVCSNHFESGNPRLGRSGYGPPTLYMRTQKDLKKRSSKRKTPNITLSNTTDPTVTTENVSASEEAPLLHVAMRFAHLTREYDVRFYTGIPGPKLLKSLFALMLKPKAKYMTYWKGVRNIKGNNYFNFGAMLTMRATLCHHKRRKGEQGNLIWNKSS